MRPPPGPPGTPKAPRRERGAVHKDWRGRRRIALVYPNRYAVGMTNLGLHAVYRLLNDMEAVVCERVFAPDSPPPWPPPLSIESGRPLTDFETVAFSLAFENDYPAVLALLRAAGIPPAAARRQADHPLLVAGGVACWLNPEPLAGIFDLFLVGEAEALLPAFVARWAPSSDRARSLIRLAREVTGAYVPAAYAVDYRSDGTPAGYRPLADVPLPVRAVHLTDLDGPATATAVSTPDTTFEADHLLEVSRGCPHGCRFCAAGYVYRPVRFRPPECLCADLAAAAVAGRVGLVGAAVSDLPGLDRVCREAERLGLALRFSSLRADALHAEVVASLARSGVKTATIAPETGSQRLRDAVNKHLDDETVLAAAERLVAAGIPNLRLYFMVGLPGETAADVAAVVRLVKRVKDRFLRASRPRGRIGTITVSLNSFVPKPFTPLQWAPMDTVARLKAKIRAVRRGLAGVANVRVHADSQRWAALQALLSRGDRRVGEMLLAHPAADAGWPSLGRTAAVNPDFYVLRSRGQEEIFPWEIVDHGLHREYLWREYRRYREGRPTPPCPEEGCRRCGRCRDTSADA